jgi:hypothetical protein
MPVWICWPAGRSKYASPGPTFTIQDVSDRSWTCCLMQHEAGEPSENEGPESVDLDRPALVGGSDVVIVSAADHAELADLLARGIRFVGFPVPMSDGDEIPDRCPMPSDN